MVALVLVGVNPGEIADGLVERQTGAEVGSDRDAIPGVGVRTAPRSSGASTSPCSATASS
jgi:hypothetical protein